MKSGKRRKYIKALERRMVHLEGRVQGLPAEHVSYDLAELAALKWAITEIKSIYGDELLETLHRDHGGEG